MNDNNHSSQTVFPPQAVAHNVNELKRDVLTLLRLQVELLAADTSQCWRRLQLPMLLFVMSAVVGLGAVPVALLAAATALAATGLHAAVAQAAVAVAALAGAAGMTLFARKKFQDATAVLRRSREELQRNIDSLKELFLQDWTHHNEPPARPGYPR